ncbi:MAG: hypothetical protein GWO79_00660, partial [Actinobacteria bacterium]|nr:hypothetical protein [Actinomycetota bacterium]
VNMDVKWGDKKENLLIMEKHIQEALSIEGDIDTIGFPELGCVGYVLEDGLEDYTEDMNDFCVTKTSELAKKYKINIISGFLEKSNNSKPYNTSFAINKKGKMVGKYHKNHLFSQSDEPELYSAGKNLCLFNFDGWRCGLATCFDIRFPRLFEKLAVSGAEIIFVPANWVKGKNKFEMLKVYAQARAGENQIYCAAVDRAGKDPNFEYTGSWMLSDPIGNDITETHNGIYHIGEVKKEDIKTIRKALPLRPSFKDEYVIKN